jgi:hypothetical protein
MAGALAVLGAGICWIALGGAHEGTVEAARSRPSRTARAASTRDRRTILRALRRGVSRAKALGGSVEAAAMFSDWRKPAIATSPPGEASHWMRMWSMSKVVVMVALLRAEGWGEVPGNVLSPEVVNALRAAITRSENCRERRVVLELQRAMGEGPAGARRAVVEVLHAAHGRVRAGRQVASPEASCVPYLETQRAIGDPLARGALLGTSEWRIADAVRFVRALAAGVYGKAVTKRAVAEMRLPKAPSREVPAGELTAPIDWGAGRALAGFASAYKAGWGGSLNGDFLAGQIALVDLSGGKLALAVTFRPNVQPPSDDPGRTAAPRAIELVMDSLRKGVRRAPETTRPAGAGRVW